MKRLSDSVMIRNTKIKHRICFPPVVCFRWSDDSGVVSDRHVAHYRSIAKGGAALVVQEATCVTKEGRLADSQLGIWSDEHIPGLQRIAEAVHAEGCPIFVQIHHAGVTGINETPLCPDDYFWKKKQRQGRRMTLDEVHFIQQAYIDGGYRAYLAGYDGIQLHGCHDYLISQFLNSRINCRTDIYGQEPARFVTEIIEALRRKASDDFIIGMRFSGFSPTLTDGLRYAKELEPFLDFFDVSYGFSGESDLYAPEGYPCKDVIYAAAEIKKHSALPVFAVNGIRTAEEAQTVLETADVDFINIARGMLVDTEWASKALQGKEINLCLHCPECRWFEAPEKCPGRVLSQRKHS